MSLPPSYPDEVHAAYERERDATIRRRLALTITVWLAGLAVVAVVEAVWFPSRAGMTTTFHAVDAMAQVMALLAVHFGRRWVSARVVATALMAFLLVRASWFSVEIHAIPELVAVTHVTVLGGLAVLLPWGLGPQLLVVLASLASYALVTPLLPQTSGFLFYTLVTFLSGALTTILGASLMDRYRRDAFARATRESESAEIATRLVRITETLTAHLAAPDLLERVCRAAVDALEADWSAAWILDDEGRVYHPGALVDTRGDADTTGLAVRGDRIAGLVRALKPGAVLAIPSPTDPFLAACRLPPRFALRSALITTIIRRGEPAGVLVHGWRERTGRFSPRQRRLAAGIAHAAAIALENARLISDLQAVSRLKSEFVAKMSHEFRTPLNVIGGYADLLLDGAFDGLNPRQHDTVARMRRSALALLELVDSTLDLGRIEAGREVVVRAPVDLSGLFAELDLELETLVQPGVTLRWRNGLGERSVVTDRLKLKTILKNLVGNALKFTAAGAVEIGAGATDEGGLVLTVRDTGVGIAAKDLPVIFEMFRQVEGSAARRFGGVGLGLHIVARLVELLGGSISVTSTPGVGSTFTVRLAAVVDEAPRAAVSGV